MFEVARDGARWLREYEGWGAGTGVAVVEEGQEPPELLRHLELTEGDARQVRCTMVHTQNTKKQTRTRSSCQDRRLDDDVFPCFLRQFASDVCFAVDVDV